MTQMETRLLRFILEREAVRVRRQRGAPPPWTKDPILRAYRFTNVHREADAVTLWVKRHIREPYAAHPNLWFMLCVARLVNLPAALQELLGTRYAFGLERRWQPHAFATVLEARRRREVQMIGAAYMVTTQGEAMSKPRYLAEVPLQGLWTRARGAQDSFVRRLSATLAEAHAALMETRGWGPFLAAQVVADLKYTRYLRKAPDWWTWAALGPGSLRGLKRVLGESVTGAWATSCRGLQPSEFAGPVRLAQLQALRQALSADLHATRPAPIRLCLQDFQNCLCEFDKYERVRRGEGRPKQLFHPKETT